MGNEEKRAEDLAKAAKEDARRKGEDMEVVAGGKKG